MAHKKDITIIIIEAPFVWNNVNEIVGTVVGSVFTLIIYLKLRKRLVLADTEKISKGFRLNCHC